MVGCWFFFSDRVMAQEWLSLLVLGLTGLQSACFVFDAEESKSLNFVVDILDQPVLLNESPEERTVQMYNTAGQAYSCQLPDTEPLLQHQRQETAETPQPVSVPGLLAPMASGPCLQRTKDFWTYEFCPMREIRQYHMEGGVAVGETSILGRFEADYDWSSDDGSSRNAKQRYHSQTYVNGTQCDLIGRPRSTEVRFFCEQGAVDTLTRIDEPKTCHYVLTVLTSRLCGHRLLAPPPGRRPLPVVCRPALRGEQIQRLAEVRLERARREAERAARWEREVIEEEEEEVERGEVGDVRGKEEAGETEAEGSLGDKEPDYLGKAKHLFDRLDSQTKRLGKILDDVIQSYIQIVSEFNTEAEYGVERLQALRERHQASRILHSEHAQKIQTLFEMAEEGHYRTEQIVKDLITYTDTLTLFSEVMVSISEESGRLKEFMSGDPDMVTDAVLAHLARTMADLGSLSAQLRRFFGDTQAWQTELLTWQAELTELTQAEGSVTEDAEASDQPSSRRNQPEDSQSSPAEDSPASSEDSGEDGGQTEDEDPAEERQEASPGGGKKKRVKFSTLRSLGLDKMLQVSEIDQAQRARIERAVKQRLGKVGLDVNGPEIKVRFLRVPDPERQDREHTLSEQELAAFESALITVMMGGGEALLEHEKQNRQARNYGYSFDEALRRLETGPEEGEGEADPLPAVDQTLFTLV